MVSEPSPPAQRSRRRLLGTVAALCAGSIAGCTGGRDADGSPTQPTQTTRSPTETSTPTRRPSTQPSTTPDGDLVGGVERVAVPLDRTGSSDGAEAVADRLVGLGLRWRLSDPTSTVSDRSEIDPAECARHRDERPVPVGEDPPNLLVEEPRRGDERPLCRFENREVTTAVSPTAHP
jgi:hypothetical protein